MNLKMVKKITFYGIIISSYLSICCSKIIHETPIPSSCHQLILVVTDSLKAVKGNLYYFDRDSINNSWILTNDKIPVTIGRNGLGWGIGLHDLSTLTDIPLKSEGDGRSPAGVFKLSQVFGYPPAERIRDIKMPYINITEMTECIDDTSSQYYNKIVSQDATEIFKHKDWQSSEKMGFAGIYYELGVVVDHNKNPINKGSGSCIFLHNWANPDETTAGCTTLDPVKMKEIVYWLDEVKNPILVQLTKKLYVDLLKNWKLPKLRTVN